MQNAKKKGFLHFFFLPRRGKKKNDEGQ